ncbi:hypothetical protein NPIL_77791 [Nephila pilipes]|uniref:Secreted protein n=1 Tax=Nephila pilipes TaxID=299642 RepID=A0A8X6Q7M0_NEPPI|nr:hypothetical protein NPIL_77791 [Nephila pilipes]
MWTTDCYRLSSLALITFCFGDHHLVPVGREGGMLVPPAINKTQQTKYKTQGTSPITFGSQQTQFPRVDCFCGFKHFASAGIASVLRRMTTSLEQFLGPNFPPTNDILCYEIQVMKLSPIAFR